MNYQRFQSRMRNWEEEFFNELEQRGKELLEIRTKPCWLCGLTKPTHIHHVDWNHKNNVPNNLAILCERCHVEMHTAGYLNNAELAAIRGEVIKNIQNVSVTRIETHSCVRTISMDRSRGRHGENTWEHRLSNCRCCRSRFIAKYCEYW